MKDDFSRSNVAFARDGFAERAQNGQRVGVRSPRGTPHDRGVGDVLAKRSSQVRAIVLKFGLDPGLSAVNIGLRGVRGADGHIQCSVGIAQSRGEDVSGPQVRARDETGNLHFSSVIALLRRCMQEGRNGVVSPRGLAQGAGGGVRRARVQNARVAGSAGDGFRGTCAPQPKADRVNVLVSFQRQRNRQAQQGACGRPRSLHSHAFAADPRGLQNRCTQ